MLFEVMALYHVANRDIQLSSRGSILPLCDEYKDRVTFMPPDYVYIPRTADGLVPYCRVIVVDRQAVGLLVPVTWRESWYYEAMRGHGELHIDDLLNNIVKALRADGTWKSRMYMPWVPQLPTVAVARTPRGDAVALVRTPGLEPKVPAMLGLLPWHCDPTFARAFPGRPGQKHLVRIERIGDVWTLYFDPGWRQWIGPYCGSDGRTSAHYHVCDFLSAISNYYYAAAAGS